MTYQDVVDFLGIAVGLGLTFALVLGVLALPLRGKKGLLLLMVPGLPWLNFLSLHNEFTGDPGTTDGQLFALYLGMGLLLSIPHLLRFRGQQPVWLGLGLGQATLLLLLAVAHGVARLSLLILELQGVSILETRNVWSILFDLVLPVPFMMLLTAPLALLLAAAVAWRRRGTGGSEVTPAS